MSTFIELGGEPVEIIGKLNGALICKPMNRIDRSQQKITIESQINSQRIYEEEFPIDDYIDIITNLKAKGATHIKFWEDYQGENPTTYCDAVAYRSETDDEYNHRMEQLAWLEKKEAEKVEAQEREQFERLKKKFSEG